MGKREVSVIYFSFLIQNLMDLTFLSHHQSPPDLAYSDGGAGHGNSGVLFFGENRKLFAAVALISTVIVYDCTRLKSLLLILSTFKLKTFNNAQSYYLFIIISAFVQSQYRKYNAS